MSQSQWKQKEKNGGTTPVAVTQKIAAILRGLEKSEKKKMRTGNPSPRRNEGSSQSKSVDSELTSNFQKQEVFN